MTAPNILFILVDDLGARDLSCFGSTFYETPHIDRLARESLRCERAYAACAVCSPTRAALLTGRSPARIGCTQFIPDSADTASRDGRLLEVPFLHHLPHDGTTLPESLRSAGYQTWHVGKWHLGDAAFHPETHGFDVNLGGCHWGFPMQGYQAPWGIPTLPEASAGTWLDEHLSAEAVRLMRERDPDRPFFLNLWHYLVHSPYQAPEHLVAKYRRKAERLGLDPQASLHTDGEHGMLRKRGQTITKRRWQSEPLYAAMVEHLDNCVGRVLAALDELGLRDETLVVFTSDNGGDACGNWPPTSNSPYREGKGWGEEGGVRVPQLLRWPGRIAPGSSHQVTTSMDVHPSLLHAAGLPLQPDQHLDGIDMLAHWCDGEAVQRGPLFWHYPHYSNQGGRPHAAALDPGGRWKLLRFFEDERLELYDLDRDPSECQDRSAQEPAIRDELLAALQGWQSEVEAQVPSPNPAWPAVPNNACD